MTAVADLRPSWSSRQVRPSAWLPRSFSWRKLTPRWRSILPRRFSFDAHLDSPSLAATWEFRPSSVHIALTQPDGKRIRHSLWPKEGRKSCALTLRPTNRHASDRTGSDI